MKIKKPESAGSQTLQFYSYLNHDLNLFQVGYLVLKYIHQPIMN